MVIVWFYVTAFSSSIFTSSSSFLLIFCQLQYSFLCETVLSKKMPSYYLIMLSITTVHDLNSINGMICHNGLWGISIDDFLLQNQQDLEILHYISMKWLSWCSLSNIASLVNVNLADNEGNANSFGWFRWATSAHMANVCRMTW